MEGCFTRAISAMKPDMGMAFGKAKMKLISDHIGWKISRIRGMYMEKIKKYTKNSFEMIIVKVTGRFIA